MSFPTVQGVGGRHLRCRCLDFSPGSPESAAERSQPVRISSFPNEDDRSTLHYQHQSQVPMFMADRDLIDGNLCQVFESWGSSFSLEITLLNILDNVPAYPEMPCRSVNRRLPAKLPCVALKLLREPPVLFGESYLNLPNRITRPLHPTHRTLNWMVTCLAPVGTAMTRRGFVSFLVTSRPSHTGHRRMDGSYSILNIVLRSA